MPAARHFELVRDIPLPRAAVWNVLSHTDRLNQHNGLPPIDFGEISHDKAGFFRPARATFFGLPMKWREYPFSWEKEGHYSVVRIYDAGPMARFEGGARLEEIGANMTRLVVYADIVPRGAWGRALVPLIARETLRKTLILCQQVFIPGIVPRPKGVPPRQSDVSRPLLNNSINELLKRPVSHRVVSALAEHLATAGDDEVVSFRAFEWADHAHLPREDVLSACLHGVKVGLLNLKWSLMCPNCRIAKTEVSTLAELTNQVHCDLCGVAYDINFDRYVELRFSIHPAIRRAEAKVFCIGGPFTAPHILMQKRLMPGESHFFPRLVKDEILRLRILRLNKSVMVFPEAPEEKEISWSGESFSHSKIRGAVNVTNTSEEPIVLAYERMEWDKQAVTAAYVSAMQEFRDLFSSEVLKPGREIAVENATLFFSDLCNSTALYERIGDASAYSRVGSHFDFMLEHIAAHNGAVVKTMGDAVMAVFATPLDAVKASMEIQRYFRSFRDAVSKADEIDLKIGLHFGTALVVNSNERLDYFGRTVNIAARASSQSLGGDFVLTGALWEREEVREILCTSGAQLSRFTANLRGVDEEFELIRVRP